MLRPSPVPSYWRARRLSTCWKGCTASAASASLMPMPRAIPGRRRSPFGSPAQRARGAELVAHIRQEARLRLARRLGGFLGALQVARHEMEIAMGAVQQAIVQEEEADESDAAQHQREGEAREDPVQPQELVLIVGDL